MGPETVDAPLLAIFLEELEERVRALNDDVLALDREADGAPGPPPAERLTTLLRTAHSLKGAARAVNVRPMERACHHLEEILLGVRDGRLAVAHDLCSLLLATSDAIEESGRRLHAGQDVEGGSIATLLPRLEAPAASAAAASRPTSSGSLRGRRRTLACWGRRRARWTTTCATSACWPSPRRARGSSARCGTSPTGAARRWSSSSWAAG